MLENSKSHAPFESALLDQSGGKGRQTPLSSKSYASLNEKSATHSKMTNSMFPIVERSSSPMKKRDQAKDVTPQNQGIPRPIPVEDQIYRNQTTLESKREQRKKDLEYELSPERKGESTWTSQLKDELKSIAPKTKTAQMQRNATLTGSIHSKQLNGVLGAKSGKISQTLSQTPKHQAETAQQQADENDEKKDRQKTPRQQGLFDKSFQSNTNGEQVKRTPYQQSNTQNNIGKTPITQPTGGSNAFQKRNSVISNTSGIMSQGKSFMGRSMFGRQNSLSPSKFGESGDIGQLKIENNKLQSTITILNQKLSMQNENKEQSNQLRDKLKNQMDSNQKLMKDQLNHQSEMAGAKNQIEILKNQVTSLVSTIDSLNKSMREKDEEIDKQEEVKNQLKLDIEELNQTLEEKNEELYASNKELNEAVTELEQTKVELEDTTCELQDTARRLENSKQRVKELMLNIENFVKGESAYIGHKEDQIDKTLATYINQMPEKEKMKIMFLRESEGVYQFGQKRVAIKIEKGNQIKVRIGGGFMQIDEFIEKFTEQEVSKLERRNVVDRFQRKINTQSITQQQSKNAVETTPLNYPQTPGMPIIPPNFKGTIGGNTQRESSPAKKKISTTIKELKDLKYKPNEKLLQSSVLSGRSPAITSPLVQNQSVISHITDHSARKQKI